jgi:zona occludens toxin (predicted ATPase)
MTGSTTRRRHSAAVYRRRRLVVLIAAIAVVAVVVWLLVAQPWSGSASENASDTQKTPDATPTSSATPGATPTPTPTEDPGTVEGAVPSPSASAEVEAKACAARDVTVEAVTDHDSYSTDQKPAFTIKLTNNGSADCSLNVGTSAQVFTVTSGADTWWRSTDCQSEPSDMVVLLTAGQSVSSASPLVWDRTRSAVGTCGETTRPRAPGGGASYHLSVEVGGIPSEQTAQFLLY